MLEAFAAGCGAAMDSTRVKTLRPGAAAFYGVRPAWSGLWQQAKTEGRDWYYLDNAWFDVAREKAFRIGINAMQSWRTKDSDGRRLRDLGVSVTERDRNVGRHVVVCRQSEEFMRFNAGYAGGALGWQDDVVNALTRNTARPILIRGKETKVPLAADLVDAWLLVTHASAAAVEALIRGIPVIVTDPHCAAWGLGTTFGRIESAEPPKGVRAWAERLADSQWTLDELKDGTAWKAINE